MKKTFGIAAVLLGLLAFDTRGDETQVHWVKVRVDPRSSGVFSIEQKIVKSNL